MRWLRPSTERPPVDPIQPNPRGKLGHTGWVIVRESLSGRPIMWFGYHRGDVWRWFTNPARAEVFDTKASASEAVANCTVQYQGDYKIRCLDP